MSIIEKAPEISYAVKPEQHAPDTKCGCYFCLHTFTFKEVNFKVDRIINTNVTKTSAFCPNCGIDAVLPEVTDEGVLKAAMEKWFCSTPKSTKETEELNDLLDLVEVPICFDKVLYEQVKYAAKSRNLNELAYIRSCVLAQMLQSKSNAIMIDRLKRRIAELENYIADIQAKPIVAYQNSRNGFICKENKNPEYNIPLIHGFKKS